MRRKKEHSKLLDFEACWREAAAARHPDLPLVVSRTVLLRCLLHSLTAIQPSSNSFRKSKTGSSSLRSGWMIHGLCGISHTRLGAVVVTTARSRSSWKFGHSLMLGRVQPGSWMLMAIYAAAVASAHDTGSPTPCTSTCMHVPHSARYNKVSLAFRTPHLSAEHLAGSLQSLRARHRSGP